MRTGVVAAVLAVAFLIWAQLAYSDKAWTWVPVLLAAVAWVVALLMHTKRSEGWAFTFSAVTIGLAVVALFGMLFPYVMPNVTGGDPALTTTNASSTDYTLTIMTWVAVIFVPIVLGYQAWSYWVFRKRISSADIANAEHGVLDEVPA
jgi:cytochrome d ubiquinol oxidase subunit II